MYLHDIMAIFGYVAPYIKTVDWQTAAIDVTGKRHLITNWNYDTAEVSHIVERVKSLSSKRVGLLGDEDD
jgi:hypothetical protein